MTGVLRFRLRMSYSGIQPLKSTGFLSTLSELLPNTIEHSLSKSLRDISVPSGRIMLYSKHFLYIHTIFYAAWTSLSMTHPHSGHTYSRSLNLMSLCICPQFGQNLVVGMNLSSTMTLRVRELSSRCLTLPIIECHTFFP